MAVFVNPAGVAVAPPARSRRAPKTLAADRGRKFLELLIVLRWSRREIAAFAGVSPAIVRRGIRLAQQPPARGRARSQPTTGQPGAQSPRARPGLSPREVQYVKQAYGEDPQVREWLLAAGLT